jgi:hypothetical protein
LLFARSRLIFKRDFGGHLAFVDPRLEIVRQHFASSDQKVCSHGFSSAKAPAGSIFARAKVANALAASSLDREVVRVQIADDVLISSGVFAKTVPLPDQGLKPRMLVERNIEKRLVVRSSWQRLSVSAKADFGAIG